MFSIFKTCCCYMIHISLEYAAYWEQLHNLYLLYHRIESHIVWRRKWQPTPVLLPGKSHGQRSLVHATVHGVSKSRAQLSEKKKKKRNPYCNRLDWGLLNYKNGSTDWSPREFEEYLRDYFKKAVSSWKLYFKCSDLWRKFCSLTL